MSINCNYQCNFVFVHKFSLQGIIDQILKHKLLFIETTDAAETTLALVNYQKV